MRRSVRLGATLVMAAFCTSFLHAQDLGNDPYVGKLAKASDDWKKTLARIKLPAGVKADIWAAEPLVANIIAFHFDEKGRCFVAETYRLHAGVTDNRGHNREWLLADLSARSVEERLAYHKRLLGKKFPDSEKYDDRVRLVIDSKGSGQADKARVFADGFNTGVSGLGSGVLARHGKVWYTCIPDLWLLEDTRNELRADRKKSLQTGYGLHVAFIGHDSHGLKIGPDGKLYFSIGDRGLHVVQNGKVISAPDCGSVLRCNLDGSDLEIVHTGLRNPQELAFDEFGNLFTGDNNADGGDSARWVHLIEGGDTGWRLGYQYRNNLGPWNAEKLWQKGFPTQAAYHLPPLDHIGNGPSGLTYHPGVSLLPESMKSHFFMCDFRGAGGGSGIHTFTMNPNGASFEVANRKQYIWSILATDCDFAPDGGFYLSDWVDGWGLPNKGRIWKFADPSRANDPTVAQVKRLLAEGFETRSPSELMDLLKHPDMRIRQEAQFALVAKKAVSELRQATQSSERMARIHGIWGLGMLKDPAGLSVLPKLTEDADAEIRAQAFKTLGAVAYRSAGAVIANGLKDPEPRVRLYAGLAAGQIGDPSLLTGIVEMLQINADADRYVRHAGVMALVGVADKASLVKLSEHLAPSVRLGAVLALRRKAAPEITRFLNDADGAVVAEAARAIYDLPIPDGMAALADVYQSNVQLPTFKDDYQAPIWRRVLAANYRLGGKERARRLVRFSTQTNLPMNLREEALKQLQAWEKPDDQDWIVGLIRPIPERPSSEVAEVLRGQLAAVMTGPDKIRAEGAKLAAKHGIKEVGPVLRAMVGDASRPVGVRVESLKALETLKHGQLTEAAEAALKSGEPKLRHQGRRILLAKVEPATMVQQLQSILDDSPTAERQGAIEMLVERPSLEGDRLLATLVAKLSDKTWAPELRLDVVLAAQARKTKELLAHISSYEKSLDAKNPLAIHRDATLGGDAEAGRKVFTEKTELSCVRCHKIQGQGGEVGPDLTQVAKNQTREYLLESIVDPNKQIAKGFETVVLTLTSGKLVTGILKSEDQKSVRLMTPEGNTLVVSRDVIDERQRGPSAMPADLVQKLSRRELRDLVEYLSTLK